MPGTQLRAIFGSVLVQPGSMLPSRIVQMPGSVGHHLGLCWCLRLPCSWSDVYLGAFSSIPGRGAIWTLAASGNHVCVYDPIAARVCVDVHDLCCHQRTQRMPEFWVTTCGHVWIQGMCNCWAHADLGNLCCLPWGHGVNWAQGAS